MVKWLKADRILRDKSGWEATIPLRCPGTASIAFAIYCNTLQLLTM
jgi:hypothetical protein